MSITKLQRLIERTAEEFGVVVIGCHVAFVLVYLTIAVLKP